MKIIHGVLFLLITAFGTPAHALERCPEQEIMEQQEKIQIEALNFCAEDSDCVVGCGYWMCDFYANKDWQDSMKGFYEDATKKLCYRFTFERVQRPAPACNDGKCVVGSADKKPAAEPAQ